MFIRFHMGPVERVLSISSTGSALLNKIAAMPIYGKTLNFFSRTKSFEAETWYIASETQGLPSCLNDDPRLTFGLFTTRSNLNRYAFVRGKY